MADDLDVQHNFRSMENWAEAREALDATFQRIFDILRSNPTLHALVDSREGEPSHKAGDFATDYRTGEVKLKMSDGKNLLEISLSALGGTITDLQHGNLGRQVNALPMHTNATTTEPGFMSDTDKVKLNGLSNATPSNATPASNPLGGAGAAGSSTDFSRADHVHPATSNTTPSAVGVAAVGSSTQPARADHVHAHGNLAGGALHAVVVAGGADGFMIGADKAKLDLYDGYIVSGAQPSPGSGHIVLWQDSGSGNLYLVGQGSGVSKKSILT